uniref:Oxidation resistance protein 1 n=1 Tax=Haptolina ericina TaxID=156174 RepID=A0A7S3F1D0_9EUKA|mmetsp:Transcript_41119/g.93040  ORF Transcript_41119/g.93040 Transcript_41119/m.93040 type:complete len:359 (+) Transcript_41119:36-1112(+)
MMPNSSRHRTYSAPAPVPVRVATPGGPHRPHELPRVTRFASERQVAEAARLRAMGGSSLLMIGSFAQVVAAFALILLLALVLTLRWRRAHAGKEGADEEQRATGFPRSPSRLRPLGPRRLLGRLWAWMCSFYRLSALILPASRRSAERRDVVVPWRDDEAERDRMPERLQKRELSSAELAELESMAPPKLIGSSSDPPTVLSQSQMQQLRRALPPRHSLSDWSLLYSTEQHGCSLRTFYSRLEAQGATLLVVLDSQGYIFGAFVAESWKLDKHYFGNGETFLFRMHPSFEVYGWSRNNTYFVLGSNDCVAFGGGEQFALYLDSSFEHGSSHRSLTYDNPPLAGSGHFKCIKVEVWGFR